MNKKLEPMLNKIIGSLMVGYQVNDSMAREATHEGYLRSVGRIDDPKAFQHYWYISSKNYLLEMLKENTKYVDLLDYQLEAHHDPFIMEEEPDTSQRLDCYYKRLGRRDQKLFSLLRYGYDFQEIASILNTTKGNIRIMKHRLLKTIQATVLLLLIPLMGLAQSFEMVRPADFRYNVTVDADTISSRSLDYKAYQDGIIAKCQYPESLVVVHPVGVQIRGCPAELIREVVKYYDNSYEPVPELGTLWHENVSDFDLEVRHFPDDRLYRIAIDGHTGAEFVRIATNCYGRHRQTGEYLQEKISGRAYPDTTGYARWESEELTCGGIMTYWLTASDGNMMVGFADIGHILWLE